MGSIRKEIVLRERTDSLFGELESPVLKLKPRNESFALEKYCSFLGLDDLSLIRALFGIPNDFNLELLGPFGIICNPPLDRLALYEESF